MYAARNVTGKHIGSLYPEVYESESQSDSSESGSESGSDDEWTRYEGTGDETALKMNECADSWNTWTPENPTERALKNAVDKNSFFGSEE
jgi:hypothetical protein